MNGAIIPCEYTALKSYYTGTNQSVIVYRSGKVRMMSIWNCSLNTVASNVSLNPIDCPITTIDSPDFLTNSGKMGRFRVTDGGVVSGWVVGTYGDGNSIGTSDTSPTFLSFCYIAKEI